jgi:hypothetical protein
MTCVTWYRTGHVLLQDCRMGTVLSVQLVGTKNIALASIVKQDGLDSIPLKSTARDLAGFFLPYSKSNVCSRISWNGLSSARIRLGRACDPLSRRWGRHWTRPLPAIPQRKKRGLQLWIVRLALHHLGSWSFCERVQQVDGVIWR